MISTFFYNPLDTIGIDISDHIIRAVLLRHKRKSYMVLKFAAVLLPEGAIVQGVIKNQQSVTAAIKKLLNDFPVHKNTTVVGLPESHGFIKSITVENPGNQEAINSEIQKHLPFPYHEVFIDVLRSNQNKTNKLGELETNGHTVDFAAIKKEIATAYLTVLQSCGVHLRALEIESQAMARLFASNYNPLQALIIGDIGRNHTTFVVTHNGHINFTHTSSLISGKNITEDLQKNLDISAEEAEAKKINEQNDARVQKIVHNHTMALANELKRVVNFHQEHTVHQTTDYLVYLTGSGSLIANLRQYLEEEIRFPIQPAKIPTNITIPKKMAPFVPSFVTALGLARRDFY